MVTIRRGNRIRGALRLVSRPMHWRLLARDALGVSCPLRPDAEHLAAAMNWLCRAQDITGCGGVSAGYYFADGWLPPYPETTGYIIRTFLQYLDFSQDDEFLERAVRMGDWECDIQLPEGGVRGQIGINDYPIVFNTGQVILGWVGLYRRTGKQKYLDSAARAGDWLSSVQEPDGSWSRYCHGDVPHAYHSRVAWPLFELAALTGEARHQSAAERCIHWVLSQARPDGWIAYMGFTPEPWAHTHTIAYTLRGLLESAAYLEDSAQYAVRETALSAATKMLMLFELSKSNPIAQPRDLPGAFDGYWRAKGDYTCLTGCAQMAIVWLKVHEQAQDPRFLNGALKLIDKVKYRQRTRGGNPQVRGAVAGSWPLWGTYERFGYPNWAAKFLADAIMLQEAAMQTWEKAAG